MVAPAVSYHSGRLVVVVVVMKLVGHAHASVGIGEGARGTSVGCLMGIRPLCVQDAGKQAPLAQEDLSVSRTEACRQGAHAHRHATPKGTPPAPIPVLAPAHVLSPNGSVFPRWAPVPHPIPRLGEAVFTSSTLCTACMTSSSMKRGRTCPWAWASCLHTLVMTERDLTESRVPPCPHPDLERIHPHQTPHTCTSLYLPCGSSLLRLAQVHGPAHPFVCHTTHAHVDELHPVSSGRWACTKARRLGPAPSVLWVHPPMTRGTDVGDGQEVGWDLL